MRFIQLILFIGLIAAVIYLWFFRKPEHNTTVIETTTIVAQTPIKRLSAFVDHHHAKIFSPLSADDTVVSAQEIRQIQASLRDLQHAAQTESEKKL
jgi:hypothetical protein